MPIFPYRCSRLHTTDLLYFPHEQRPKFVVCPRCGRKAHLTIGLAVTKWKKAHHPNNDDNRQKVAAWQATERFQSMVRSGEIVHESEFGINPSCDNLDGDTASSDTQTAIMAQYALSDAAYQEDQARLDKLVDEHGGKTG